jgi:hypothetical protein
VTTPAGWVQDPEAHEAIQVALNQELLDRLAAVVQPMVDAFRELARRIMEHVAPAFRAIAKLWHSYFSPQARARLRREDRIQRRAERRRHLRMLRAEQRAWRYG